MIFEVMRIIELFVATVLTLGWLYLALVILMVPFVIIFNLLKRKDNGNS